MKTRKFYMGYLSLLIFFMISFVRYGQSESVVNKYNLLKINLNKNESELDSLNVLLKRKINLINIEKEKKDNSKIVELLSSTSNLTNRIELQEIELESLKVEFNLIKKELYSYYSNQIDSIKKISGTNISPKIVELTEKKLAVSNKIDLLSFEPAKVIGLVPTNDSIKKQIYYEYLSSAKQEVDEKITEIKKLKSEIRSIITLNEEKEAFLEEFEFENNISRYNSGNQTSSLAEADYFGDVDVESNSLKAQAFSFNNILTQLKFDKRTNQTYSIKSIRDGFYTKNNLKDFFELISQVENQLADYQIVIKNKLESK